MIFVTVGTHEYSFDRLIQAADELAGIIEEEVVIQRGYSLIVPQFASYFDVATLQEAEKIIQQARIVIAHAGAGTIISIFKFGKPMVLVPREAAFGEVLNNHQLQLATMMVKQGYAIAVPDPTAITLLEAIKKACELKRPVVNSSPLIEAIRHQLTSWQDKPVSKRGK